MAVASLSVSAERSNVIDFVPYFSEFGGILIRELEADKLQVGAIRPVLYTLSTSIRTTRQHDRTTKNSMFPNTGYMLEFLSFFLHTHRSSLTPLAPTLLPLFISDSHFVTVCNLLSKRSYQVLVDPFKWSVWVCIVFSIPLAAVFTWALSRLAAAFKTNYYDEFTCIHTAAWYTFGSIFYKGWSCIGYFEY